MGTSQMYLRLQKGRQREHLIIVRGRLVYEKKPEMSYIDINGRKSIEEKGEANIVKYSGIYLYVCILGIQLKLLHEYLSTSRIELEWSCLKIPFNIPFKFLQECLSKSVRFFFHNNKMIFLLSFLTGTSHDGKRNLRTITLT